MLRFHFPAHHLTAVKRVWQIFCQSGNGKIRVFKGFQPTATN